MIASPTRTDASGLSSEMYSRIFLKSECAPLAQVILKSKSAIPSPLVHAERSSPAEFALVLREWPPAIANFQSPPSPRRHPAFWPHPPTPVPCRSWRKSKRNHVISQDSRFPVLTAPCRQTNGCWPRYGCRRGAGSTSPPCRHAAGDELTNLRKLASGEELHGSFGISRHDRFGSVPVHEWEIGVIHILAVREQCLEQWRT